MSICRPDLRFLVVSVTLVALLAALVGQSPVTAAPGQTPPDREQPDTRSAMAAARAHDARFEDLSQRTEDTQVYANPDGTWTAEIAPEPVRVKDELGAWKDIDPTLERDGREVRPRAAAAAVQLSAGGDRTFAAMTVDGRRFEWRWPVALPEPVLDGATATYRDVVQGGDLVVTATNDGFSHSVVLREAPAGPLDVDVEVVTPGARLEQVPEGGLLVRAANGDVLAEAPAPLMWDSSENEVGDPAVRPLRTVVAARGQGRATLTLSPDPAFLADPATVYPVTVDPSLTANPSGDTWLQRLSHTSSQGGSAELRAGTYDGGSHIARSYLTFSQAHFSGRQILSATLLLRNFDSTDCGAANIRVMRINRSWSQSTLTWSNQPGVNTSMYEDFATAYGATGCASNDARWNVTDMVSSWASGAYPNYGFRLSAVIETNNNSWRRYRSVNYETASVRPRLSVTYNRAPSAPGSLAISPCVGTCSPRITDSLTPTLSARATDPDLDNLTYTFQVAPAGSTTVLTSGTSGPLAQNTTATWQVPAGKLVDDASYQFRVAAFDGRLTTWSGWVGFSVGVDRPPATPTHLSLSPCEGTCTSLVSTSLNPDLTAVVSDPDSESVDALFEVREMNATSLLGSGSDLVTSGETARHTVEPGLLKDGGTYEFRVGAKDALSTTWSGWTSFDVRVDTSAPGTSLRLAEPLVVWDDGPELVWTHYKDPSTATGDDLVEYQIFRGCVELPGTEGCPEPSGPDYTTDPSAPLELVGTVDSDRVTWTDESAAASAADKAATYYYWVGARTVDDVEHSRVAQVASSAQKVTTPREGRVRRILTGNGAVEDPAVDDTTISKTQQGANLGRPNGPAGTPGDWLQVGNSHPTYGVERALLWFDTGVIDPQLTVTDAELQLHQVGGAGAGATFELRELTRSFAEDQATWLNAADTIPWTSAGGDLKATVLDSLTTDSSAKKLELDGTSGQVTAAVRGWVSAPTTNHGLALRTTSETAQQWINLASSEASDVATRPRLVVEHLKTPPADTFVAPEVPERYLPSTVTTVPVTVTNTTATAWPAGMILSYRWTLVGQTQDESTANDDRLVPLERALEPGESVELDLTLRTPINSATGEKLKLYDLHLDLLHNGTWWSTAHPYTTATLTSDERSQRICKVVRTGLLCPNRVVDAAGSKMLGLEKFYAYAGEETGAGAQFLTNLSNGNAVWSYDAMQNPSVGPSMFTRVAYNSQDTGDTGAGFDWSVQVSTLSRLGTKLVVGGNNKSVTLVDGDGTEHIWLEDPTRSTATTLAYHRPPGVALELTGTPGNTTTPWVFKRPDGTRFLYGADLLPSSVVDINGNALTFTHTDGRLTRVTDAKGRVVAQLGYDAAGLSWIRDISGRALKFTHNSAHQLITLEDGGGFNTATGLFTGAVKRFQFAWTTDQPNSALLRQITDPRGASTFVSYYLATDDYPLPDISTPSFIEGYPKELTDRMGRKTVFRYYDADGSEGDNIRTNVIDTNSQDSQLNETTTYRMDGFGRTVLVKDAEANAKNPNPDSTSGATHLGWDADHNVVRLEEPNGAVSRWQYHPVTGYPLRIWDAEAVRTNGRPQELTYGTVGQATVLKSIRTPLGRTTTFDHDAKGNLTGVIDPLGKRTTYTYNPDGTQATAADARQAEPEAEPGQFVTTFSYDPAKGASTGYPTRITPPAGVAPTDFTYDVRGNVTLTSQVGTDATLTTTATYDVFGRPTAVTSPGAQGGARTNRTTYDLNDNITTTTAPNGAIATTTFLADDQISTSTLPANSSTSLRRETLTYDAMGRLDTVTSPQGNRTSTAGDHVVKYDHDRLGQPTRIEQLLAGPGGSTAVTTYEYDSVGNLVKVVDPRRNAGDLSGYASRMVYDHNARPIAAIDAAGFSTRTRYDADGQVVAEIDQRGVPKTYEYYANGLVKSVSIKHTPTGEQQQTWVSTFEYDAIGNRTKVIRPHVSTKPGTLFESTEYDANNLVTERRGAFDPDHTRAAYRDPAITYFEYDDLARLKRQSMPTREAAGEHWTVFEYFASGDIKTSTDPWNISTSYEYDKLGQQTKRVLRSATGAATRTMTWTYFPDGSLATRDDTAAPAAASTVDNSDATGVALTGTWATSTVGASKIGPDFRTHATADGTASDADRFTWTLTSAATDTYRIEVSCPAVSAASTAATYSISGAGVSATRTLNQRLCSDDHTWHNLGSFQLTGAQAVKVALAPSAGGPVVADAVRLVPVDNEQSFSYSYDADGRQVRVDDETTNPRIDAFTTDYDDVGRVRKVQEIDGTTTARSTTYTYDINGNTLSVLANRGEAADPADRGNLAASRYTAYTWDLRDMVETVSTGKSSNPADLRTWSYTYDPRGLKATWTKPGADRKASGNVTKYAYHESGLVRSTVERTPSDVLVASHQLWFNPDGDRTRDISRVDNADTSGYLDQTADYSYTPSRQLAKVTKSGTNKSKNEDYLYDAAGNIEEQSVDGKSTTFDYDRNRLISSTTSGVTSNHNYDPFGRLQTITALGSTIQTYTYDGFDRLVQEKKSIPGTAQVLKTTAYDPFDRATLQTVTIGTGAPKKTRFNYLGMTEQVAVEEEPDAAGAWKVSKTYNYGPDGRPLMLEDTPVVGNQPDKTHLYSVNPHGDTETLTDPSTGQSTATYRYTAYGSTDKTGTTGADKPGTQAEDAEQVNPYRFNSKRFDAATDKYDMGFRNYDPGLNRYLSRDMYNGALNDLALGMDPWNTNRYAFAGGNPITGVELDGHCSRYNPVSCAWEAANEEFNEHVVEPVSEFAGGASDELTFGGTRELRELLGGGEDPLDTESGNYEAGEKVAFWGSLATGIGGVIKAGVKFTAKKVLKKEADEHVDEGATIAGAEAATQTGQVAYGSTDLSKIAIAARKKEGIMTARNTAVFEYRTDSGELATATAFSQRGVRGMGHAERNVWKSLENQGVEPSDVTRIYSELEPCNAPGGYCSDFIASNFPKADVSWSFPYYGDAGTRQTGVNALKDALAGIQ